MAENWRLIHYKVMAEAIQCAFEEAYLICGFEENVETAWNSSAAKYEHDLLMGRYNVG